MPATAHYDYAACCARITEALRVAGAAGMTASAVARAVPCAIATAEKALVQLILDCRARSQRAGARTLYYLVGA